MKYTITTLAILGMFSIFAASNVNAGTLAPTHAPGNTMYSLQDIYNLITASTTSEIGDNSNFTTPVTASESMVTLVDIYNAIMILRNSTITQNPGDIGGNDDDDTGVPPVVEEDINNHDNISSRFIESFSVLDTFSKGRFGILFEVEAIEKDIYIPETVGVDSVLVGNVLVVDNVTSASATLREIAQYDSENFVTVFGESVNGYFVVPAGTTKTFRQYINIDNTGNVPQKIKLGLDYLEYKVNSNTAGLRKLDLDQSIYKTAEMTFSI